MALPTEPMAAGPGGPTSTIGEQVCAALSGRYAIEPEVGRGRTALVFVARDLEHDRLVALKVIRPELASVIGAKRFLREIALATRLKHPHIIPPQDYGAVAGLLYYVTPYVEGESLRARLGREHQLPLDDALQITRDVAAALRYAHSRRILHRDISPEGILLAPGRALLADFGIAQAVFGKGSAATGVERLAEAGLVGTPAYVSPEVVSGSRVDRRTDIYSLGCVLYEMLGGEPPYTGPTPQAVMAKHTHEPVPQVRALREGLPAAVEQAVTRALAKAPADRFQIAEEFAAALAPDAISATGLAAEPALTTSRYRLLGARGRWTLAAAGLIAAVGAAALALRDWPSPGPRIASLDSHRVVVAVFANETGDPSLDPLGDITADYLARGLAETRLAELIDARAEQAGDADAHPRDVAGARALGRIVGARSVVWGAYARTGDSLRFQAQLTDAATGEGLGATTSVVGSARQPTQGVELLRQRMMTTLAARLDPEFSRFEGSTRPASYDAYREYLAGEALDRKPCPAERDCPAELIAHYSRAYALDSSFTLPLIAIAVASSNLGECARTNSIAQALRPRREQLPVAERARLSMAAHLCGHRPLLAQEAARQAMAALPRSDAMVVSYAWFARHNGFLREAIAVTELGRKRNDPVLGGANLIIPYHLLGEHERELEVARAMRSALPGNIEYLSFEARALVGLGRLAEVNIVLAEMLRVPEEAPQQGPKSLWLDEVGRDLRAHGHLAEARATFERGIRWYEALPPRTRADDNQRRVLAVLLYDLGRWREALPIVREFATKDPDDVKARSKLGAVYARLGDRKGVGGVDRWLAHWKEAYRDFTVSPTRERARLAAILGERDRAVALLQQAAEEGDFLDGGAGFGVHSDPDFESLRDYPPFQELTRPKD